MAKFVGKVFNPLAKLGGGAVVLAMAVHGALINSFDAVTTPIQDYMAQKNIPAEVLKDKKLAGARVFDRESFIAQHYMDSVRFQEKLHELLGAEHRDKRLPEVSAMDDQASLITIDGRKAIAMPTYGDVYTQIHKRTGIPVEDLEFDKGLQQADIAFMLGHEFEHLDRYRNLWDVRTHNDPAHVVHDHREEVISDEASLDGAVRVHPHAREFVLAWRGVAGMRQFADLQNNAELKDISVIHNTAPFIENAQHGGNDLLYPDLHKFMKAVNDRVQERMKAYSVADDSHRMYLGYLDLAADVKRVESAGDPIAPAAKQIIDLYIKGYEYLAPTRAAWLRENKDSLLKDEPSMAPAI